MLDNLQVAGGLLLAALTCVGACAESGSTSGPSTSATTGSGEGGIGGQGDESASVTTSSGQGAHGGAGGLGGSGGIGGSAATGGSGGVADPCGDPPAPPPAELVAWYRFEGGSSTTISDSSMYGNHGTASVGVTLDVPGRHCKSVRFDGQTSNIEIPSSASLNITGDITLEAWVFLDTPQSYNRMLIRKVLQYQMSISVVPEPNLLEFYTQPLGFARTSVPVLFGHWVHVATSHDGSVARLYMNGELADEVSLPGGLPSNNSSLRLGGDGFNQNAPNGGMDEVKIWNVVRTEQEICEDGGGVYNAALDPKCTHP